MKTGRTHAAVARKNKSMLKGHARRGDGKTAWRLTPRARLERELRGSAGILLDTYNAAMCACNDTAWTLLRLLKRGASIDRLARELVVLHDATRRDAQADALAFVRRLRRMGLVDGRE